MRRTLVYFGSSKSMVYDMNINALEILKVTTITSPNNICIKLPKENK